jgi:hypothetical protein
VQAQHSRRIVEDVGHGLAMSDVLQAAAHEALDRNDGVARIERLSGLRLVADSLLPSGR